MTVPNTTWNSLLHACLEIFWNALPYDSYQPIWNRPITQRLSISLWLVCETSSCQPKIENIIQGHQCENDALFCGSDDCVDKLKKYFVYTEFELCYCPVFSLMIFFNCQEEHVWHLLLYMTIMMVVLVRKLPTNSPLPAHSRSRLYANRLLTHWGRAKMVDISKTTFSN